MVEPPGTAVTQGMARRPRRTGSPAPAGRKHANPSLPGRPPVPRRPRSRCCLATHRPGPALRRRDHAPFDAPAAPPPARHLTVRSRGPASRRSATEARGLAGSAHLSQSGFAPVLAAPPPPGGAPDSDMLCRLGPRSGQAGWNPAAAGSGWRRPGRGAGTRGGERRVSLAAEQRRARRRGALLERKAGEAVGALLREALQAPRGEV